MSLQNSGLPVGTVDRIIRKDTEVKSVSRDAVVLIAKSAVCFTLCMLLFIYTNVSHLGSLYEIFGSSDS
jgi:hypothetical protein